MKRHHLASLIDHFKHYRDRQVHTDVQLVTRGGKIKYRSHSLLLAAASKTLKACLQSQDYSEEDVVMIIPDMTEVQLNFILDLIYSPIHPNLDKVMVDRDILVWLEVLKINFSLYDPNQVQMPPIEQLVAFVPQDDAPKPIFHPGMSRASKDLSIYEDVQLASDKFKKNKNQRSFECDYMSSCVKSFPTKQRMILHKQQVHGFRSATSLSSPDLLTCAQCKTFTAKSHAALEIHQRSHTGDKPHQCDYCDKSFACESYLEQHVHTHNVEKIHVCPQCSKSFQSLPALSQHKQTHAPGSWTCQECDVNFKTQRYLYQHQQRKHVGKKKFTCETCLKVLSGKEELINHKRIHTGEKPFKCRYCPATFRFRSSCNTHMKIHKDQREFECLECSKRFIQATDLQKHMRTHTKERPYKCSVCDKAFARRDYLKKHSKLHPPVGLEEEERMMEMAADVAVDEDLASNVNALLGDAILSDVVELESLETSGEPMQLVLDENASDWLKQGTGQLVIWDKSKGKRHE